MKKFIGFMLACFFFLTFFISPSSADINRVRVVNDTNTNIYIHKGGYAPSVKIPPGKWQIFDYPFYVIPPGKSERVASSKLIATAGGRWIITPNGYTYLGNPTLVLCLDYKSAEHEKKAGNRVWTIQSSQGFDSDCAIEGYKQPWYQPQSQPENQYQNQEQKQEHDQKQNT